MAEEQAGSETTKSRGVPWGAFVTILVLCAVLTFGLAWFLTTIFQRKMEAKNPYVRLVDVTENTTDPAVWGTNWPREYDSYQRTVDVTRTRYGGSEAIPQEKLDRDPWLKKLFAGYAFSIDYRDRRGHAYMLADQEATERVTQKPQPGACLHCHASIIPTYRRVGLATMKGVPATGPSAQQIDLPNSFEWPAVMKGFEVISAMSYTGAHAELLRTPDGTPHETTPGPGGSSVTNTTPANTTGAKPGGPTTQEALAQQKHVGEAHPVSCVDCHDPKNMELRVTRPGFVTGIRRLAESDAPVPHLASIERWRRGNRKQPYDPNVDASRQEMRSYVCGQCHVEYYCGPKETLLFPWGKGLRADDIEAFWDEHKFSSGEQFYDWQHGITGAHTLKAQHPEFETWSQGVHARSGVACADCHMPYKREGALKVSDHWVRSPLLMVNRSCQVCHPYEENELKARVYTIQDRTAKQIDRAGKALDDMINAIVTAKGGGATPQQLAPALDLQRKGQWRLDFVYAENSMGFHADQETARVLGEAIDYMRQAQIVAQNLHVTPIKNPTTFPTTPVQGVTPTENAPPAPYKTEQNGQPVR
ncbi:MAG TPA: ammonia-forming cytochrome c nitrite reductase subunit c552 [Tepidisphaeraceae bacterium]|jgi:nitrite reductase (cytochrome c-552)